MLPGAWYRPSAASRWDTVHTAADTGSMDRAGCSDATGAGGRRGRVAAGGGWVDAMDEVVAVVDDAAVVVVVDATAVVDAAAGGNVSVAGDNAGIGAAAAAAGEAAGWAMRMAAVDTDRNTWAVAGRGKCTGRGMRSLVGRGGVGREIAGGSCSC